MKTKPSITSLLCGIYTKLGLIAFCALAFLSTAKAANSFYYNFDNQSSPPTVFDVSGNNHDGTISAGGGNAPTFSTAETFGGSTGSILFSNPTGGNVTVGGTALDFSGDFTLSLAFYATSLPGGNWNILFGAGQFQSGTGFMLSLYANGFIDYFQDNTQQDLFTDTTVTTNAWHTIEVQRTGGTVTLIYDSDPTPVSASRPSVGDTSAYPTKVGYWGNSFPYNGTGFNGYIDNVAFNYTPVPEPSTVAMLGFGGIGGLVLVLHRRLRKA